MQFSNLSICTLDFTLQTRSLQIDVRCETSEKLKIKATLAHILSFPHSFLFAKRINADVHTNKQKKQQSIDYKTHIVTSNKRARASPPPSPPSPIIRLRVKHEKMRADRPMKATRSCRAIRRERHIIIFFFFVLCRLLAFVAERVMRASGIPRASPLRPPPPPSLPPPLPLQERTRNCNRHIFSCFLPKGRARKQRKRMIATRNS